MNEVIQEIVKVFEKAKITGLEEAIVHLIEMDIDKATLGWIKTYCEELEVDFLKFIS